MNLHPIFGSTFPSVYTSLLFKCFREHKEKGTCEERIAKGLHIKPVTKEDTMDIKEKLAIALKERKRKMKELGIIK